MALAPPQALLMALNGLKQGRELPCQVDHADMPEYLIEFVSPGEHVPLRTYLDEALPNMTEAEAAALFAGSGAPIDGARGVLVRLRELLTKQHAHG